MADIKLPFEDAEAEVLESTIHAPVRKMTFDHFERTQREKNEPNKSTGHGMDEV